MKKIFFASAITLIATVSSSQNIGIGEPSPGAKLTIKGSDASNKNFLVKTMSNDTSFLITGHYHSINGYVNTSQASLTIGNRYFGTLGDPQLKIVSWGEKTPGFLNGSMSRIDFRNINNMDSGFSIDVYSGSAGRNYWSVNHEIPGFSDVLFFIEANGNASFGGFPDSAKLQINHVSSIAVPTLKLADYSSTSGPIIQFANSGGSDNWQVRSTLNTTSDRMDFFYNNNITASLNSNGSFGIGISNPQHRLHVNSTGSQPTYAQFTNSTTGITAADGLTTGVNGFGTAFILNREATPMYFGTAGLNRMMIDASGRVGIGVDPPSEVLDVNGNIESSGLLRVTGEVNRPATSSSHLLPIAYGSISTSGGINHSSGNITVTRTGLGDYSISIAGENYIFSSYVAVVTPVGSSTTPILAHTNSVAGNLLIYTFNISGSSTDANFSFVVYRQ